MTHPHPFQLPTALACFTPDEALAFRAPFEAQERSSMSEAAAVLARHIGARPELHPLLCALIRGEAGRADVVAILAGIDTAIARGQQWAFKFWKGTGPEQRRSPWHCWDGAGALDRLEISATAPGAGELAGVCLQAAARRWDELRAAERWAAAEAVLGLSPAQLRALVATTCEILWPGGNPDAGWTQETICQVEGGFIRAGLRPNQAPSAPDPAPNP